MKVILVEGGTTTMLCDERMLFLYDFLDDFFMSLTALPKCTKRNLKKCELFVNFVVTVFRKDRLDFFFKCSELLLRRKVKTYYEGRLVDPLDKQRVNFLGVERRGVDLCVDDHLVGLYRDSHDFVHKVDCFAVQWPYFVYLNAGDPLVRRLPFPFLDVKVVYRRSHAQKRIFSGWNGMK